MTIATVRPATILADVAIAVNPDDERYTHLIGKEAIVPVVERRVPIIADERVDPSFGTGALKITPGHDPTDFEIGRDHGLPELTVIGFDGRMTGDIPAEYVGLTEDEADELVVAVAARSRPAREARELPALRRALRAFRHADPAARVAAVVVRHEGAGRARDRGDRVRARDVPSARAEPRGARLAALDPPVERFASALVGPPAPDLVLRERPRDLRGDRRRTPARSADPPS